MAVAVSANFFWNLVVTLVFDELRVVLGTCATFGLFAAIDVVALAFVFFLVPETKGLSLEMIESVFAGHKRMSLQHHGQWISEEPRGTDGGDAAASQRLLTGAAATDGNDGNEA